MALVFAVGIFADKALPDAVNSAYTFINLFHGPERLATVLAYGDIELDREKRRVARSGRSIDLGPTEYRLLEFFLEHPGRVFSREQLLDSVWGRDIYIDERTVDVHIGRLRKLLNPGREQDPIRTVRGAGYALDDRFAKAE